MFYSLFCVNVFCVVVAFGTKELQAKTARQFSGWSNDSAAFMTAYVSMRYLALSFCLSLIDIDDETRRAVNEQLQSVKATDTLYDMPAFIRSYFARSEKTFRIGNDLQNEVCVIFTHVCAVL